MNNKPDQTTNSTPKPANCTFPPCTYVNSDSHAMRQHVYMKHVVTTLSAGSFQVNGIPEFDGDNAVLRCCNFTTAEGLTEVELLQEDETYGPAASALLKKLSEVNADESSGSSASSGVILDATGTLEKRVASSDLTERAPKRVQTRTDLLVTQSADGYFQFALNFSISARDLGLHAHRAAESQQDICSLLQNSPFVGALSRTTWVEFPTSQRLPAKWDGILSGCWLETPLLNFATAVLFAGCILYSPRTTKSILCLVAESYGRGHDVDIHAEKPICVGSSVSSISQPSTSGLYPQATVCRIQTDKKDRRLVLGCKYFNILFTEVWRLEKDCASERAFTAGTCASAFPFADNEDIRIFIDQRSFDLAFEIASGEFVPRFQVESLRQIRSHLCSPHSFRMGRAASPFLTNMVSAQAATIFTLSIVRPGSGDSSMVSSLLCMIAKKVNSKGRDAVIKKHDLLDVVNSVSQSQVVHVHLNKILSLFEEEDEIKIISSSCFRQLEPLLGSLAASLSSALYACNRDIVVPLVHQELSRHLQ
ncbi:hypothetical protein BGZ94_006345 [Podila epigama]|nr:hypothetical protein BGZ94_006345 [Podila epigama]